MVTDEPKRIEDIIPEINTDYNYELNIPEEYFYYAKKLLGIIGRPLIITNASWRSVDKDQVSNTWSVKHYIDTAKLMYEHYNVPTVLIGTADEVEIAKEICSNNSYFINCVNSLSIGYILGLLIFSDLVWGFQGGIGMLADRFQVPIIMLWPIKEFTKAKYNAPNNFINGWVRPESIKSKRYVPLILGKDATPDNIFNESKRLINGMEQRRLH